MIIYLQSPGINFKNAQHITFTYLKHLQEFERFIGKIFSLFHNRTIAVQSLRCAIDAVGVKPSQLLTISTQPFFFHISFIQQRKDT